jgi:hypothetical protein
MTLALFLILKISAVKEYIFSLGLFIDDIECFTKSTKATKQEKIKNKAEKTLAV